MSNDIESYHTHTMHRYIEESIIFCHYWLERYNFEFNYNGPSVMQMALVIVVHNEAVMVMFVAASIVQSNAACLVCDNNCIRRRLWSSIYCVVCLTRRHWYTWMALTSSRSWADYAQIGLTYCRQNWNRIRQETFPLFDCASLVDLYAVHTNAIKLTYPLNPRACVRFCVRSWTATDEEERRPLRVVWSGNRLGYKLIGFQSQQALQ